MHSDSLEFYRDSLSFCGQSVFVPPNEQTTAFICTVQGMRELLCGMVFEQDQLFSLIRQLVSQTLVPKSKEYMERNSLGIMGLWVSGRGMEELLVLLLLWKHCCCYLFKIFLFRFLNVQVEEQLELFQEISQLCTRHWHGLISAAVNVKVPTWSFGFSTALDARIKLMDIIKDKLENDKQGFVGSLGSLLLPDSSSAAQHFLLFISALIPKALSSLFTSFLHVANKSSSMRTGCCRKHSNPMFSNILWFVLSLNVPFYDSTLVGFHIPKYYGVIYISHAVHRDPEVFYAMGKRVIFKNSIDMTNILIVQKTRHVIYTDKLASRDDRTFWMKVGEKR
uniref:Uncharacterized protein n=1 Tax=Amphilophus citrinellus TaxID=61819 RepID=A0A3Q0QQL7_AMPCI